VYNYKNDCQCEILVGEIILILIMVPKLTCHVFIGGWTILFFIDKSVKVIFIVIQYSYGCIISLAFDEYEWIKRLKALILYYCSIKDLTIRIIATLVYSRRKVFTSLEILVSLIELHGKFIEITSFFFVICFFIMAKYVDTM
jgi:hypothetical protein